MIVRLGQVFVREVDRERLIAVVIGKRGDDLLLALAPNHERQFALPLRALERNWDRIAPAITDWYIEAAWQDGTLAWGFFIPTFEAAWAFMCRQAPDIAANGGRIRVSSAENWTAAQMMSFDDADCFGPEPFIGYDAAVKALEAEED